jgi:hypothetical protein
MRCEHPGWGKRRIADELAKGNNYVPLVSPNTVKRILHDAGLWSEPNTLAQKRRPIFCQAPILRSGAGNFRKIATAAGAGQ